MHSCRVRQVEKRSQYNNSGLTLYLFLNLLYFSVIYTMTELKRKLEEVWIMENHQLGGALAALGLCPAPLG